MGCTLKETEKEKDLAVMIYNKLSFKDHVAQATAKGNRMVGLIRRSFDYLNERTFVLLFKSMVRPKVKVIRTWVIECALLGCTLVPSMKSVGEIAFEIWPVV